MSVFAREETPEIRGQEYRASRRLMSRLRCRVMERLHVAADAQPGWVLLG